MVSVIDFATIAEAASTNIAPSVNALRLLGGLAVGDGGAGHYLRSASQPAHLGKIHSNDGAWWELKEGSVCMAHFSAPADGVADDAPALNAALGYQAATGAMIRETSRRTFNFKSQVNIASGFDVDMGSAHCVFDGANGANFLFGKADVSAGIALTADCLTGARWVELGGGNIFQRGDYIYLASNAIFDPAPYGDNVKLGEMRRVAACDGGRVMLDGPASYGYTLASSAKAYKIDPITDVRLVGGYWHGAGAYPGGDPLGGDIYKGGAYHQHVMIRLVGGVRFELRPHLVSDFHYVGFQLTDCMHGRICSHFENAIGGTGYGISIENASVNVKDVGSTFCNVRHGCEQGSSSGGLVGMSGITRMCGSIGSHAGPSAAMGEAFGSHAAGENIFTYLCTVDGGSIQGIGSRAASHHMIGNSVSSGRRAGIYAGCDVNSIYRKPSVLIGNTISDIAQTTTTFSIASHTGVFWTGEKVIQAGSGAQGIVQAYQDVEGSAGAQLEVQLTNGGPFISTGQFTGQSSGAVGTPNAIYAQYGATGLTISKLGYSIVIGNSIPVNAPSDSPIVLSGIASNWAAGNMLMGNVTRAPANTTRSAITYSFTGYTLAEANLHYIIGGGASVYAMSGGYFTDRYGAGLSTGYTPGFADWPSG